MNLLLLAAVLAAAGAEERLAYPPGPHGVGFRVFHHRDFTRKTPDGQARPLQVAAWYPAAPAPDAPRMRYRDYVLLAASERTLAPPDAEAAAASLAGYEAFLAGNGVPVDGIREWLAAPMTAVERVPSAPGRFPVVLLAHGMGGTARDQAALAEHLASQGYVVVATPSPVRLGDRMESEADVLPMARAQAADLATALDVVRGQPAVDAERLAVVGYSFGGRSALLAAARLRGVRALVSLDGGLGTREAKGWLPAAAFARRRFRVPVLHVYEDQDEAVQPDFELIESLSASPRALARVAGLRHLDFITYGLARSRMPALAAQDAGGIARGLDAAARLTRAFLAAHLGGGSEEWDRLSGGPGAATGAHGVVAVRTLPAR